MLKKIAFFFMFCIIILAACKFPTQSKSKYNPPADHKINKSDARHKSGLYSPLSNCVSCHGDNLKGGSVGVSCFECHNKKW